MSDAIKYVSDASFDQDVLKSSKPVLLDFWAEWCGPCRAFVPVFEEVSGEEKFADTTFVKCNVDMDAELPAKYGIRSIPTVKIFNEGEVIETVVGVLSEDHIKGKVKEEKRILRNRVSKTPYFVSQYWDSALSRHDIQNYKKVFLCATFFTVEKVWPVP